MYAVCGLLNMLARCWATFSFFELSGEKKKVNVYLDCYLLYTSEQSVSNSEKSKSILESSGALCAVCFC